MSAVFGSFLVPFTSWLINGPTALHPPVQLAAGAPAPHRGRPYFSQWAVENRKNNKKWVSCDPDWFSRVTAEKDRLTYNATLGHGNFPLESINCFLTALTTLTHSPFASIQKKWHFVLELFE